MPEINRKQIRQRSTPYIHQSSVDAHQYYDSTLWRNLRGSYIRNHPFCEECDKNGRTRLATEVHHIKPFLSGINEEERWTLLTDPENLMSLCSSCHDQIHRSLRENKNKK